MLKVQEQDAVYAGKTSDDGTRNKKQHEGKGKGWACNNHNLRNPDAGRGYACCDCCMPIPCLCLQITDNCSFVYVGHSLTCNILAKPPYVHGVYS